LNHISEEDLIAYQLQEAVDASVIRQHLEICAECGRTAESIAETLRVFSAEPVPQANLDHAWQRLRGSLPPMAATPRRTLGWRWLAVPVLASALLAVFVTTHRQLAMPKRATLSHLRAGPFTEQPRDPDLANHLESAERLLTEVSHSNGPLDEGTRAQAQNLLLTNSIYIRKADADGDVAEAAVLDRLDRTLTTLEHEPTGKKDKADDGWHLRFEMSTNGLLFDLRILQQNDSSNKENK
jgi:hypothetical protein